MTQNNITDDLKQMNSSPFPNLPPSNTTLVTRPTLDPIHKAIAISSNTTSSSSETKIIINSKEVSLQQAKITLITEPTLNFDLIPLNVKLKNASEQPQVEKQPPEIDEENKLEMIEEKLEELKNPPKIENETIIDNINPEEELTPTKEPIKIIRQLSKEEQLLEDNWIKEEEDKRTKLAKRINGIGRHSKRRSATAKQSFSTRSWNVGPSLKGSKQPAAPYLVIGEKQCYWLVSK
jgi:hypothetical protein